jgi:pimeloyl-ACP methyl ester carboxylesterase
MSEQHGMRHWRGFFAALNAAGFDVLITDLRGNGISDGVAGFNTAGQANDMFRELDQMETGDGLRLLTPSGQELAGTESAGRLMAGMKAREIPVVLAGYARGSYATAWAMHKNFVEDCDRDVPDGACRPPLGRANIKGVILYGPNSAGLGYRLAGHDMIEAALRTESTRPITSIPTCSRTPASGRR